MTSWFRVERHGTGLAPHTIHRKRRVFCVFRENFRFFYILSLESLVEVCRVSTKHLSDYYLHWEIGSHKAKQHTFAITKAQIHAKNPMPMAA